MIDRNTSLVLIGSKVHMCPVPWCRETEDLSVTGYKGMEFVICGNCGCQGPEGDSEQNAIDLWNVRGVEQEDLVALLEESNYLSQHSSVNERERNYYTKSGETIHHLIAQLNSVVDAWEELPGGQHQPIQKVSDWVNGTMANCVNRIRGLLKRKTPGSE